MKIAVGLRTCSSVFNYWDHDRIVDANKDTIVLTCLNSLLKSIKKSKHEIVLSIHDDSSSDEVLYSINELCKKYEIDFQLISSGKLKNFQTQYEWIKSQECDYVYCVEDDYLHVESAIDDMISICEDAKEILESEYAVYPFNNPHRYTSFNMMYTSYVLKGSNGYWRSSFHSTHTFFMSKNTFKAYDDIMKFQAYSWPSLDATEDNTINKIWLEQKVKLLSPIDSLAFHLADKTQEERLFDWKTLWKTCLI